MPCLCSCQPPRGSGRLGAPPENSATVSFRNPCTPTHCTKKAVQVASGIAVALCLQLGSPIDSRASEDMISVPRGALEELIVRDFASRVHAMEPTTLAAFLDSLRSMSAPDPKLDTQQASRFSEPAVASAGSGRQNVQQAPSMQPQPQIAAAEAKEQLSRRTESSASQSSTGAGQLPQPELRVPETSATSPSSDPFDDVTAELLGLRERQAEVQPRDSRSASARSALSSSIKEIVGMPLAIWAFLDTLLPEPLRAGQELTEEVQRAVLATKGIVLIVSSTLAYFVARGLSRQLFKAVAGIPLLRAIVDASSSAAENISKLNQKSPGNTLAPPSTQQRDSTASPRRGDVPATTRDNEPQQRDRSQGADTPPSAWEQQLGRIDAVRNWVIRAADVLPGSSESEADLSSDSTASPSVAPSTAQQPPDSQDISAEDARKSMGAVPLLPNAQTAMLSLSGSQSAQPRGGQSKRGNATSLEDSRLVDSATAVSRRSSIGRQARGSDTQAVPEEAQAVRSLASREAQAGDIRAPASTVGRSSGPGVLWKRTAGQGTGLSGKWGDSSDSAVATSTQAGSQQVEGGSMFGAAAQKSADCRARLPVSKQQASSPDSGNAIKGSGSEQNEHMERFSAYGGSKERRRASSRGTVNSESPRVYNGVRPGSAQEHNSMPSGDGSRRNRVDSAESNAVLNTGTDSDARSLGAGADTGTQSDSQGSLKTRVKASADEGKTAQVRSESVDDPWFV